MSLKTITEDASMTDIVRVDDETLTHATSGHVASYFEGQRDSGERIALIRGFENGPIIRVPRVRVLPDSKIKIFRFNWVRRQSI